MADKPPLQWPPQSMFTPNVGEFSELNKEFADAMSEAGQTCFEGMREFQSELFRFAAYRADENTNGTRNLFDLHSLSDLVDLQQTWLRRFSEQYVSETERVLGLMQRTTETAWAPFFNYEKHLAKEADKTLSSDDEPCEEPKRTRKKAPRST